MSLCDRCKNKCKFMLKNKTLDTCSLFEKQTNFDRITASPEALAKFLGTWFVLPCKLCEHFRNDKCTEKISKRHCDDAEAFEKWLNEESKE